MIDLILGPLGALLAALVFTGGAWLAGRSSGRTKAQRDALRDYQDTRRRMDDAEMGNDPAVIDEFLRDRAKRRDL